MFAFSSIKRGLSINYPVSIIISDVFLCLLFPQLKKNIKKSQKLFIIGGKNISDHFHPIHTAQEFMASTKINWNVIFVS